MSNARRTTIIRRRLIAGAVVLGAAVGAPVAVAATNSAPPSPAVVHTAIQKDGTVQVSGYDGGAGLYAAGQ